MTCQVVEFRRDESADVFFRFAVPKTEGTESRSRELSVSAARGVRCQVRGRMPLERIGVE